VRAVAIRFDLTAAFAAGGDDAIRCGLLEGETRPSQGFGRRDAVWVSLREGSDRARDELRDRDWRAVLSGARFGALAFHVVSAPDVVSSSSTARPSRSIRRTSATPRRVRSTMRVSSMAVSKRRRSASSGFV
jgi:hypothetical protein